MAKFNYHALIWKEGKLYVARCLELKVTSQGKSRKEALANLREAVDLYLEDEDKDKFFLPKIDQPQITQIKTA